MLYMSSVASAGLTGKRDAEAGLLVSVTEGILISSDVLGLVPFRRPQAFIAVR